jgi:hypothetical protein
VSFHATLSPSTAERWINCPGSIALSKGIESSTSIHAEGGTAAHALLELALRMEAPPESFIGATIHTHEDHGKFVVDEEMAGPVGHAYDYIQAWEAQHPHGHVLIEERVHWGKHPAVKLDMETASGTGDAVLVDHTPATRSLVVLDYKHGAGVVVEVNSNPQVGLYGAGELVEHPDFEEVEVAIIQPRSRHDDGPVRSQVLKRKDINVWMKQVIAPAVKAALAPNAPTKAGEWCRWCPAKADCRTLVNHIYKTAGSDFSKVDELKPKQVERMTPAELARAMDATDVIEAWVKDVRARVTDLMRKGTKVPRWKLVRGKQGNREWAEDQQQAVRDLCAKLKLERDEYEPRSLLSVAQLEKLFKAAKRPEDFSKFASLIYRAPGGGMHAAPVSDPRPEYSPASDFSKIE